MRESVRVSVIDLKRIKSRLEYLQTRLSRHDQMIDRYAGSRIDAMFYSNMSEDCQQKLNEYAIACDELIKEKEMGTIIKVEDVKPKLIKTTPSNFPDFDGLSDYEVWKDNWKTLAKNSGLNEECLNIKLRESIKWEAQAYMGTTGMCAYTYNQMWAKMEKRYSLP